MFIVSVYVHAHICHDTHVGESSLLCSPSWPGIYKLSQYALHLEQSSCLSLPSTGIIQWHVPTCPALLAFFKTTTYCHNHSYPAIQ